MVQVSDFDEKKTDVNLAFDMIAAAWSASCEQVVLCTNDSDIEAALATIRKHCPAIRIGLVAPIPGTSMRGSAASSPCCSDCQGAPPAGTVKGLPGVGRERRKNESIVV